MKTPVSVSRELPLAEFLATVTQDVYEGKSWEEVAAHLMTMTSERRIVEDLLVEWRRDGRFREPVRVEEGELGNGFHRLTALLLAGADVIEVTDEWRSVDDRCEAVFTVQRVDGKELDDDDYEMADHCARSLPGRSGWIESDCCHLGRRISYIYQVSCEEVLGSLDLVLARFLEFGYVATLVRATPYSYDDLEVDDLDDE